MSKKVSMNYVGYNASNKKDAYPNATKIKRETVLIETTNFNLAQKEFSKYKKFYNVYMQVNNGVYKVWLVK